MKIGTFFMSAALALFVMAGFFASSNRALAAECEAQIADTKKQYAASKAKFKYSEKLAGRIEKMLKKARLRLDQGKKKGCFKIIKKVRKKIAYRENKAGGGGKGGGKQAGKGGGNKAKCAAELKAVEKRYDDFFMNTTGIPAAAQRKVDQIIFKAEAFKKEGKYKKCLKQVKNVSKKLEFFEGR
jgi:hypothetical protein